MANLLTTAVARQLGSLFEGSSVVGLSDRQLLERFNAQPDETAQAAFAALVSRHGPMVLGICRQSLGDLQHAEDAFQAVFFVLARRARSIQDPDLLGNWLYGVALRTARKAKIRLSRQRAREADSMTRRSEASFCVTGSAQETAIAREHAGALYDEIARLPLPFRVSVVLCYFEGLSLDEAAQRLGCPAGTVHSRLDRARTKLRRGLIRRGIVLSGATLTGILEAKAEWASISTSLADLATQGAMRFANRTAVAGALSACATTLAHDVLRSILVKKLTLAAIALVFLGTLTTVGLMGPALARPAQEDQPPAQARKPEQPQNAKPEDAEPKPAPGRMFVVGRVLDPQGRPVPNATAMVCAGSEALGKLPGRSGVNLVPIGDARADGSGRFRLDAPRTSSSWYHNVSAVAIAPGYGVGWVAVNPDADQPAAEITLQAEHAIHGRFFDVQGRPVPGVTISVSTVHPVQLPELVTLSSARADGIVNFWWTDANNYPAWPKPVTTDAEGRFTLRGVGRNQRVNLTARHPQFALQRLDVETDGGADSKPMKLALEPAKIITGRVTYGDTGKPVPHAQLCVAPKGPMAYFETDAEGRFRVNPPPDERYFVAAWPPTGQPYLALTRRLDWPKGAVEQSLDLALPRGVTIRGRVTIEGSGQPVAGATVQFLTRRVVSGNAESQSGSPMLETAADGCFHMGALPGPGWLLVMAASEDYVLQPISSRLISGAGPDGRRTYSHAHVPLDLKPSDTNKEVHVTLRPGMTVRGQVVGPDGQPARDAWIVSRIIMNSRGFPSKIWVGDYHETAPDGHFEIHGLDPNADVPVHFLDPKRKLGATAIFSGKSSTGGPVTVRLEACGTARARIVDPEGKPIVGPLPSRTFTMVITPGLPHTPANEKAGLVAADENAQPVDRINYEHPPASDAAGRLTLPALIPGAIYRITDRTRRQEAIRPQVRKEFTVKPGETLDLGDILIEKPMREAEATP
jgi:RNA polymerase sigma factor (sigma-70 family)